MWYNEIAEGSRRAFFIYQQTTAVLPKRPTSFSKSLVNRQDGGFLCDAMTKKIPLTQGKFALVDDNDYEELSKYKWYASEMKKRNWYAGRNRKKHEGKDGLILMHRFIMKAKKGTQVDHIDGNGLNNQRSNIRICTNSQNQANKKMPRTNKSGYKGVSWFKRDKKWRAKMIFNGKDIHIGLFKKIEDAAKAYDLAAVKFQGEFAKINFPNKGTR